MKKWADNHPKAKLMAEKRAAILSAARRAFLASGYEGTSMEAIAAEAGVSIMTLYRHARTKDDLFEAVVSQACEPPAGSDDARVIEAILQKPLADILTFVAIRFRDRLTRPETLGLLRAVMVEHEHFPHLGQLAFEGLIASHVRQMTAFIATRPEAKGVRAAQRAQLSGSFFDQLLGTGQLRALLGLPTGGTEDDPALPRRVAKGFVEGLTKA